MARIRKKLGEDIAIKRGERPAASRAPNVPTRTSPRQGSKKKNIALESVANRPKEPALEKVADPAQAPVLETGKKRKKEDNLTAKKKGTKKGKMEDVPPGSLVPLPTLQAQACGTNKENPTMPPVIPALVVPVNMSDSAEVAATSVDVSRQPFGQSSTVNLSVFQTNKDLFSDLLRLPQDSNLDSSFTKQPPVVTQVASSQESMIVTETARNLTFDLEAAAEKVEIMLMEGKDNLFDLKQSLKEWELNNVYPLPDKWLRLDHPEYLVYEFNVPCPPLEKRSSGPGIDNWMTSYLQSKFVRRFFPNIDRRLISIIQSLLRHNYLKEGAIGLATFPLEAFISLNPWNNLMDSDSPLQKLSMYDVYKKNPGKGSTLYLRKSWVLSSQRRAWMGFVHREYSKDDTNPKNPVISHAKRLHTILHGNTITPNEREDGLPSLKELNVLLPFGESFFVTTVQGQLDQDLVLSVIQFKRLKKFTFINFLATRQGTFTSDLFGTKVNFMEENQTFQKMGLALLLLRTLQLLCCCSGSPPRMLIQAKSDSVLYRYLIRIGFNVENSIGEDLKKTFTRMDGLRLLKGEGHVFLTCNSVLGPIDIPNYWSKSKYPPQGYLQHHQKDGGIFPDDDVMAILPFDVSGNYIDQASSHLIFLGHPFFYHRKPLLIAPRKRVGQRQTQVILYGSNYNQLKTNPTVWFQGQHIQLVNQWLFRDTQHPILNEFFVVPIDISTTFRSFNEFTVDMDVFSRTLHRFCLNNYTQLYKRFIFYLENIAGSHWILHVAINPFAALTRFLYPTETTEFEHGVFTYDPFGKQREQGCERQLIFLLNALSYYRDLAVHGMLDRAKAPKSWEKLWTVGGRGPFGCYTDPGMIPDHDGFSKFVGKLGPFRPKKFKDESELILKQTDGYNCGLYCTLFIMDFVMTQWKRSYSEADMTELQRFGLGGATFISLPQHYGLGTTFCTASADTTVDGSKICTLVRLEIVCLMERLHALYYNAYSREDKSVPSTIGQLSKNYGNYINSNPTLRKAQEASLNPILPTKDEIETALKIGYVSRERLKQESDFNLEESFMIEDNEDCWKEYLKNSKCQAFMKSVSPRMSKECLIEQHGILGSWIAKRFIVYKAYKNQEQFALAHREEIIDVEATSKPQQLKKFKKVKKAQLLKSPPGAVPSITTLDEKVLTIPVSKSQSKNVPLKVENFAKLPDAQEEEEEDEISDEPEPPNERNMEDLDSIEDKKPAAKSQIKQKGPPEAKEPEAKTKQKQQGQPEDLESNKDQKPKSKSQRKKKGPPEAIESKPTDKPPEDLESNEPKKPEGPSKDLESIEATTKSPNENLESIEAETLTAKSPKKKTNKPVLPTQKHPLVKKSPTKKKVKKNDKSEDESVEMYHSEYEGSEKGKKKGKKRMIIAEEDSDDDQVEQDDDDFVSHIDVTLAKPKVTIPLFSQPLVLSDTETRSSKKTAFYQPIAPRSPVKSKRPSLKKKEKVPLLKYEHLPKKEWNFLMDPKDLNVHWVPAPPQDKEVMYKDFFEPKRPQDFDLQGVPNHQKSYVTARNMSSLNMSREQSQTLLTKMLSTIKDQESREAYSTWWHQSQHLVMKEGNITYWKNNLHLRFKPSLTGRKERLDGTLHGSYESIVTTEEGGIQVSEVCPDWVVRNVSAETRAILHRVSTDWNERHINSEGRAETGFLTLEGNDDKKGEYTWDNRQISKIRYLPPKAVRSISDKERILKERWRGVIRGLNNAADEFVWLDQEWIDETLSKEFIGFVKSTRSTGTEGYVRIPEGSAEDQSQRIVVLGATPGTPKITFRREGTVQENDRSCVVKSAASALAYLGYERLSFYLCNDLKCGTKTDCGFEFFQQCMLPSNLKKKERKEFQFMKWKKGLTKWNVLTDSQNYLMCLVGLQSDDHKTDHAISVAGQWIFDSNFECALPLTKESLDFCCSSDCRKSTFVGVTRVCMLKAISRNVNI